MKKSQSIALAFRTITAIFLLLVLLFFTVFYYRISHKPQIATNIFGDTVQNTKEDTAQSNKIEIREEPKQETKIIEKTPVEKPLPAEASIIVPYTRQAPFSVWDALHEDACEEASLLMVKHFLDGTKISDKQSIDNEIIDLVNFEEEKNYKTSITLDELAAIAKSKYGMGGTVKKNITNNDIKKRDRCWTASHHRGGRKNFAESLF